MSEPSAALRVVIASDNFLTREGLGCLLSGARGIEIIARVDSHPETLTAIRQYRPDVLIVGIRTPRVTPRRHSAPPGSCALTTRRSAWWLSLKRATGTPSSSCAAEPPVSAICLTTGSATSKLC